MKKNEQVKAEQIQEVEGNCAHDNPIFPPSSVSSSTTRGKEEIERIPSVSHPREGYATFFQHTQFLRNRLPQYRLEFRGADLDLDVVVSYTAIFKRYRKDFKSADAVPFHRILDLNSLQGLLEREEITHVELHDEMRAIINKMLTGLVWKSKKTFYATGNSDLKSFLEAFLVHPAYSREAMQKRDERRVRLRAKYARMQEELNGQALDAFEFLDARNQSLKEASEQYQQRLIEKNKCIQELTAQIESLNTLEIDPRLSVNDFSNTKEEVETLRNKVKDLEAENQRLRLQQFRDKHSTLHHPHEGMPANEEETAEEPKEQSFIDSVSTFFSSFFN